MEISKEEITDIKVLKKIVNEKYKKELKIISGIFIKAKNAYYLYFF